MTYDFQGNVYRQATNVWQKTRFMHFLIKKKIIETEDPGPQFHKDGGTFDKYGRSNIS